jgi:T4 RnlA family RNA ligase
MFTLSQALSAIKDKPEFSAKDKGTYTVIDYNLSTRDTFTGSTVDETMILHNLRGTAFDNKTGEIIRLAYHKFFNYGEFPELDAALNFNDAHVITQKMDGSMIAPIYASEGVMLGTRAGRTDIADMASDFAVQTTGYVDLIFKCSCLYNATPIFEFCSRKNRVVLDYPEDQLVLTGVRYIDTGTYMPYKNMVALGKEYDVPVVKQFSSTDQNHFAHLRDEIASLINDEGIVIRFESGTMAGHMVKIKADQYVKMHKAVDGLKFAKDVALLSLQSSLDDIYPILDDSTAARVRNFSDDLQSSILRFVESLKAEFNTMKHIQYRKDFAEVAKKSKYVKFLFGMLDGKPAEKLVIDFAKRQCGTQQDCSDMQQFIGMTVKY